MISFRVLSEPIVRRALVLSAALLLAPAVTQAAEVFIGEAARHDTSPPLSHLPAVAPASGENRMIPIGQRESYGRFPDLAEPDAGVQGEMTPEQSAAPTPAPIISFEGLSDDDNAATLGFRIVPPDVNGDIGLDHNGNRIYVQYINSIWAVFDADTGVMTHGPSMGNSFWQGFGGVCESENDGDPVVLYDDFAGQWMFSQFAIASGTQCVAISTTANPLGPYHRYAFVVTPGGQNDYPKLGVWDDGTSGSTGQSAYTFTLRDFGGAGGSFSVSAGVMERDAMLVGGPAQFIKFSNPCNSVDCIEGQIPPHQDGPQAPAGTCPTFWAAADSAFDDSPHAVDGYRNHTLCVDWSSLGSSTYAEGSLVPAGSNFDRGLGNGFGSCIGPVNGGENLDCLAIFTMNRPQYRRFGTYDSVVLNTTVDAGSDRAGIRWAEVRKYDGQTDWELHQDGTYAPADGVERWMGSIAQDQSGNIALGYSATSGSLFPAVRYTSRAASDAAGTMPGGEQSCIEGTGAQTASNNRWGDYSSMSVDPVDDCTFWYTQEYYENTNSFDFTTRICSFKLGGCGGPECTIDSDCNDPQFCNGVETCSGGVCQAGTPPCGAGQVCDEVNDVCLSPTDVHVENIVTGTANAPRGRKYGTATVTIYNDIGAPVGAGYTVEGQFSGSYDDAGTAVTDSNGRATFQTSGTAKRNIVVNFCVNNVTGALPYDPNDNANAAYACDAEPPPPPPPPTAEYVHVESIDTGSQGAGGGAKYGKATITLLDENENPVGSGHIVTGDFSGDISQTGATGTTNSSGVATILTTGTDRGKVTVSFCVSDVSDANGLEYRPADNTPGTTCQ